MKKIILLLLTIIFLWNCNSTKNMNTTKKDNPVRIANDELEYEITIFDIGFETYLNTIAKPMNYYSESYLETKNKFYVSTWNQRARDPLHNNSDIYENIIDYDYNIHYGLEVNYKLYNYFKFVEYKYKEHL